MPSGVTSLMPLSETNAIQSPVGDHSGTQHHVFDSSAPPFTITCGGAPLPARLRICIGVPPSLAGSEIHSPSCDQPGADSCGSAEPLKRTGAPPPIGVIQIAKLSVLRNPSGGSRGRAVPDRLLAIAE